jgi:ferrous iron transport protein A
MSVASQTMSTILPLELLSPGESATIESLHGDAETVHRMEELGLRSGVKVEMVQTGSPCIIRVNGCKLCFRKSEILHIFVQCSEAA